MMIWKSREKSKSSLRWSKSKILWPKTHRTLCSQGNSSRKMRSRSRLWQQGSNFRLNWLKTWILSKIKSWLSTRPIFSIGANCWHSWSTIHSTLDRAIRASVSSWVPSVSPTSVNPRWSTFSAALNVSVLPTGRVRRSISRPSTLMKTYVSAIALV